MPNMVAHDVTLNKLPDAILTAIGNRISEAINEQDIPTASLAVFHYDTPILNAAWGWVDPVEKAIPTSTSTLFDLSSLTRAYTAVATLAYISTERIYLQSPIVQLVRAFGQSGLRSIGEKQIRDRDKLIAIPDDLLGKTVDPKTINLFHLLTHTSGLPEWRDLYSLNPPPPQPSVDDTRTTNERWEIARTALYNYPFVELPETSVIISDIGYMILGDAISHLDDELTFDMIIRKHVLGDRFSKTTFSPMQNGFAQHEIAPTERHNVWRDRPIWGEVNDNNASSLGGVAGHAGLFSTAFEVGLFGNMWLYHAEKLFKVDSDLAGAAIELQAQTGRNLFGLGWMLKAPNALSHGDLLSSQSYGQQGDLGTSLWIDPQEKLVIALLTNHSYSDNEYVNFLDLQRDIHNIIIEFVQG
ncbi:MAG: serine hydrolase [Phototrophicaceae bacterium]